MRQKRPLSILEVMVGIALAGIVMAILFGSLRQITFTKTNVQKLEREIHARALLQLRLQSFFSDFSNAFPLICEGKKLEGTIEGKFDLDPDYTGDLACTLVLEDHIVKLKIKEREEHLIKEVDDLKWEFFDFEKKQWQEKWKGQTLPLQIRLTVKQKKKAPLTFYFHTGNNQEISLK